MVSWKALIRFVYHYQRNKLNTWDLAPVIAIDEIPVGIKCLAMTINLCIKVEKKQWCPNISLREVKYLDNSK